MRFIPPARLFREKRAARRAEREAAVRSTELVTTYRSALEGIAATAAGVKVPNGTTKKIARIADEALAVA